MRLYGQLYEHAALKARSPQFSPLPKYQATEHDCMYFHFVDDLHGVDITCPLPCPTSNFLVSPPGIQSTISSTFSSISNITPLGGSELLSEPRRHLLNRLCS